MKRFTFRLERLLQLREAAEREQARVLAAALSAEEAARTEFRLAAGRLHEAQEHYLTTPPELSQAGTRQNLELTLRALTEEVARCSAAHEGCLEKVELDGATRHRTAAGAPARSVGRGSVPAGTERE
jgi:hypothetical protein